LIQSGSLLPISTLTFSSSSSSVISGSSKLKLLSNGSEISNIYVLGLDLNSAGLFGSLVTVKEIRKFESSLQSRGSEVLEEAWMKIWSSNGSSNLEIFNSPVVESISTKSSSVSCVPF
jgi:hypothetical protein